MLARALDRMRAPDPDATFRDVVLARVVAFLTCALVPLSSIGFVVNLHGDRPVTQLSRGVLVLGAIAALLIGKYCTRSVRR